MIDLLEIIDGVRNEPSTRNPSSACDLFVKVDARTILSVELVDVANFLQHRILTNSAFYHRDERIRGVVHRYTNLKADYLRKVIPKRIWAELINQASAAGLIERSQYIPHEKCFGYRIGDRFAGNPTIIVQPVGKHIRKKILATRQSRQHHKIRDKTYRHLLDWLGKVTIPESDWADIQERGYARHVAGGGRLGKAEYFDYVQTQLLAIRHGRHRFGVDDYGRVQTTFSNLIKPARERLTIGGQPLLEIDIANSQPVFLTELLLEQFRKPHSSAIVTNTNAASATGYLSARSTEMGVISIGRGGRGEKLGGKPDSGRSGVKGTEKESDYAYPTIPTDVIRWISLVESGTLYRELMELIGWQEDRREEFKRNEVFAVLYGNPTRNHGRMDDNWNWQPPSQLKPILAEHFPTVWAFIICYYNQHGHGSLARELQRRESRLMIRGVCGTLAEKYPEVPVVPCHDAILTTPPNIELIQSLILGEFAKRGLHPTLKTTGTMPTNGITMGTVASMSNQTGFGSS